MVTKFFRRTILLVAILGFATLNSFSQDMILLCQSTSFIKSHLSAYPERLIVKEFKNGEGKTSSGEFTWAEFVLYDKILECTWKYIIVNDKCSGIVLTINTKSDLNGWIETLDDNFYRTSTDHGILWIENGEDVLTGDCARVNYDKNQITFTNFCLNK
jgi:hypothetical protein